MEPKSAKTAMGLEENVAGLLCYVLGWVTGIVFFVLEKENRFVRFHAMQSIATFLPLMVVAFIIGWLPFIGWLLGFLLWILTVVLWVLLMLKAYRGERYKLPVVGAFAEKQTSK